MQFKHMCYAVGMTIHFVSVATLAIASKSTPTTFTCSYLSSWKS